MIDSKRDFHERIKQRLREERAISEAGQAAEKDFERWVRRRADHRLRPWRPIG